MSTAMKPPSPNRKHQPATRIEGISRLWDGTRVHQDVAIVLRGGTVVGIGPEVDDVPVEEVIDADGLIAMPGLVDCHTHTTFAGSRVGDFVRRLGGANYTALLEGGGGIHTTVTATRAAGDALLLELARARLRPMLNRGVTTVEIKSGYGLTVADEARLLRTARAAAGPLRVEPTFLGAHAIPRDRPREDYLDELCGPMLAACAPLATAVDVYCDRGAFTLAEADRIRRAGRALGLAV